MNDFFSKIATRSALWMGHPWAFVGSCLVCLFWAISGPFFDYSDTWQLVINTATTVITFLMVFLVQNTQNRDTLAMQLKIDELIRVSEGRNKMLDLNKMSLAELEELRTEFERLGATNAEEDAEHVIENVKKNGQHD